jgi:hypothetical protein
MEIRVLWLKGLLLVALSSNLFAEGSERGAAQPPLNTADFSVFSKDATMNLFLLAGQSNMKGRGAIDMNPNTHARNLFFHSKKKSWYISRDPLHALGTPDLLDGKDNAGTGPGMSFAMTLLGKDSDLAIGLVPAAVGGVSINHYDKRFYDRSLMQLKDAEKKSSLKAEIKAILWLQGETDAKGDGYLSYEQKLLRLVDRYRADLNNPELPFIVCTIGSFLKHHERFTHFEEINEILLNLPTKRKYTACVDARELKMSIGDDVHYSTEAQIEIGKRFAAAYMKLIEK